MDTYVGIPMHMAFRRLPLAFVFLFCDDVEDLCISQMFASNESLAAGGYVLPSTLSQHYRFTTCPVLVHSPD